MFTATLDDGFSSRVVCMISVSVVKRLVQTASEMGTLCGRVVEPEKH